MRRWLAALCLVPAVSWGQGIDCNAERAAFYEVVDVTRQLKEQGATKRQIIEHAAEQDSVMIRDTMIEAADGVYSTLDFSDDDIVSALHNVCMRHQLQQRRAASSDR